MPKVEVGNKFIKRNVSASQFKEGPLVGDLLGSPNMEIGPEAAPVPFYRHPNGELWVGDSVKWMSQLEPSSVDLIFADPPYNLGKVDWDHFESHDDYIEWSSQWIQLASKALKPTGSLYICGFSEVLADLRRPAMQWFEKCRWLIWFYKNKANLTNDWGRSHESILHLRKSSKTRIHIDDVRIPYGRHTLKYPSHPQATSSQYGRGKKREKAWTPNPKGAKPKDVFELPVTSNGMTEKTPHPTQKPEELVRKFILASSSPGDVVIDPFVGSGTTLVCAQQLKRRWAGCEINPEYCSWAVIRISQVPRKSTEDWIAYDRETAARRVSIR